MNLRNRKEFWPALGVLALGMLCFWGSIARGDAPNVQHLVAVDSALVPPEWVISLLSTLKAIPYVGPILIFIGKWTAILAAITTALAAFLISTEAGLDKVSGLNVNLQWMGKIADQIGVITPWLKWMSLLNHPEPWKATDGGSVPVGDSPPVQ